MNEARRERRRRSWGTGKGTLKSKQNNIVHTGKATDLQRSGTREKELHIGHIEFCLPKDIQIEISYIDVTYSLSKKDLGKKKKAIRFPHYKW